MDQEDLVQQIIRPFKRIAKLYSELDQTTSTYGTGIPLFPPEIHAITAINAHPGSSLTELSQYLDVTKGTTTKLIQKLVKKGMVVKTFAPNSENQLSLMLTSKGKIANESHTEYVAYLDQQLIAIYQKVPSELLPYFATVSKESEKFFKKLIKERQE